MLPRFLVIGAMKAGTTTLYEDLRKHPSIFLPEKELGSLNSDDALTLGGRARYGARFGDGHDKQICGEVSATYAKLPDLPGVVDRASRVLGDRFKVLYLVRDPVDRVVSHHHHELSRGRLTDTVDTAVRTLPRLIDYTRYGMQIAPWVGLVGADRVRVVQFEKYVADRAQVLDSVFSFLGVSPLGGTFECLDEVHNPSEGGRVAVGRVGRLARSTAYRRVVRPFLPERLRRFGGQAMLSTGAPRPDRPAASTVDLIIEETEPELRAVSALGGECRPEWDLEKTRQRYAGMH